MDKYIEIKWHGKAGQGVGTAAQLCAEILAMEGKYVQAFPEFNVEKRPPAIKAYNRFSVTPIKQHTYVEEADIVVIMEPSLILNQEIGINIRPDAVFIVNTDYEPQYIKEKLNVSAGQIYTLDADTIAREEIGEPIPNIPMISIIMQCIDWISLEKLKEHLRQSLTEQLGEESELVEANLATIDRALNEVKFLDNTPLIE